MARSGKKIKKRNYITIEAPVMHVNGEPVWMDRHWFPTFLDFLKVNHFKISGIDILNGKIKVRFSNPDHVIMFGLTYNEYIHEYPRWIKV